MIKILTEPKVYLVSFPQLGNGVDQYLADRGVSWYGDAPSQAEHLCEVAGRLCYDSFSKPRPGGNTAYLQHIKEVQHGSVLEHANFSFILTGISRSLSHELVRHRAGWAYSQESQRYVDESDVAFVLPPALLPHYQVSINKKDCQSEEELLEYREAQGPFHLWRDSCELALSFYRQSVTELLNDSPSSLEGTERRKWARQAARSVLPNCAETKVFCTANARALRHFLEMRASRHADVEIRRLAVALWRILKEGCPNLFGDYTLVSLPDVTESLETAYRKV